VSRAIRSDESLAWLFRVIRETVSTWQHLRTVNKRHEIETKTISLPINGIVDPVSGDRASPTLWCQMVD
jgi:hypothetical protein